MHSAGPPPALARPPARAPRSKVLSHRQAVEAFGPGRSFRLVFTNGCFDLLHPGHVEYLSRARQKGDALLVAVNTDASVRRLGKDRARPYVDQDSRALVVAALEFVDCVTLFDEDTPAELIAQLEPDMLVKGGDYAPEAIAGADLVKDRGGTVTTIPLVAGHSTTALARRIRASRTP